MNSGTAELRMEQETDQTYLDFVESLIKVSFSLSEFFKRLTEWKKCIGFAQLAKHAQWIKNLASRNESSFVRNLQRVIHPDKISRVEDDVLIFWATEVWNKLNTVKEKLEILERDLKPSDMVKIWIISSQTGNGTTDGTKTKEKEEEISISKFRDMFRRTLSASVVLPSYLLQMLCEQNEQTLTASPTPPESDVVFSKNDQNDQTPVTPPISPESDVVNLKNPKNEQNDQTPTTPAILPEVDDVTPEAHRSDDVSAVPETLEESSGAASSHGELYICTISKEDGCQESIAVARFSETEVVRVTFDEDEETLKLDFKPGKSTLTPELLSTARFDNLEVYEENGTPRGNSYFLSRDNVIFEKTIPRGEMRKAGSHVSSIVAQVCSTKHLELHSEFYTMVQQNKYAKPMCVGTTNYKGRESSRVRCVRIRSGREDVVKRPLAEVGLTVFSTMHFIVSKYLREAGQKENEGAPQHSGSAKKRRRTCPTSSNVKHCS